VLTQSAYVDKEKHPLGTKLEKFFSHFLLGVNMKALLVATTIASLALATTANAASFTFGNLVITQISPENPTTFNNNPIGPTTSIEASTVCDSAYCGPIQFVTDGAVANGTTGGVSATPAGDSTNYLYGVNGVNILGFQGRSHLQPPGGPGLSELLQYRLGLYRRVDDEPEWDAPL
jgi:hypothetical protein